jgi:aldehyde dehydrogenase (NAD+)
MATAWQSLVPSGILIDGAWRETEASFDDLDPSTEEVFAAAPDGTVADMESAVAAARRAADRGDWARRSVADRAKCLRQLAEGLTRHADEVVALASTEWGMTANDRGIQIDVASHFASDAADKGPEALADEDLGNAAWGISCTGMRAPLGVVAAITPWNFPHSINMQKLAPALIAGNAFVLKPSPLSPLAGLALAKIVHEETDIPPGIVNVVSTSSQAAAEVLTTDPRVDLVTLVGSAATAQAVGAAAAKTMKRTIFELGGKSAAIYLDDFDVASLTPHTAQESCALHAGQACTLLSRLVVHDSIYDAFVERFAQLVSEVTVGDPKDPSIGMGPLIDARARDRVLGMIDRAVADGARLVTGGRRPSHLDSGFYVEPTVLADVDNRSAIAQEEVFGPVACVIRAGSDEEAIAIANDSDYGLIGTVFSPDKARAIAVARQVNAGVVTYNGAPPYGPFGGWKRSGIGREGGVIGIRGYTEMRAVTTFS